MTVILARKNYIFEREGPRHHIFITKNWIRKHTICLPLKIGRHFIVLYACAMYVTWHSLDNQDRQGRPLSLTLHLTVEALSYIRPFGVCCDCGRNTVDSLSSRSLDRLATTRGCDCFTLELLVFAKISELLLNMLLGSFWALGTHFITKVSSYSSVMKRDS